MTDVTLANERGHATDVVFEPRNPVASFVDDHGEQQIIHRPKGRRLSVFRGGNTPALRMNRAAAILMGRKLRARRLKAGLSQTKLSIKAGLKNVNPKQYISALETGWRREGMRFGTLYALAHALDCEIRDLMPSVAEVVALAGVSEETIQTLMVA